MPEGSLKKQLKYVEGMIQDWERIVKDYPLSVEYKRTLVELQARRLELLDKLLKQSQK